MQAVALDRRLQLQSVVLVLMRPSQSESTSPRTMASRNFDSTDSIATTIDLESHCAQWISIGSPRCNKMQLSALSHTVTCWAATSFSGRFGVYGDFSGGQEVGGCAAV